MCRMFKVTYLKNVGRSKGADDLIIISFIKYQSAYLEVIKTDEMCEKI